MTEFAWFVREYPRVYRYHFSNARHRLTTIHQRYQVFHKHFAGELAMASDGVFQTSVADHTVQTIYWDFEALLNAVSSALDTIARILSTAYAEQAPPDFHRLAVNTHLKGFVPILAAANTRWVKRLKDYRNCFVHETSVDTHLSCGCTRYGREWQVRCKLPLNPNARDIMKFRWSRRRDVLTYALSVWRHLIALDRKIARLIENGFRDGSYPAKTEHLFPAGARKLSKAAATNPENPG